MKPRKHLVEISIFSLNHVYVRLTKIMNNLVKDRIILTVKVIFQPLKLIETFTIFFCEESENRTPTYIINDLFSKNVPNFFSSVHNFGWSDDDM